MKKNKYCIFITLFLIVLMLSITPVVLCQDAPTYDKLIDFLPPAPNAAAIVRYGNSTINKNTGVPQITIPLYTIKGIKLNTNISLGYSSNGIKVDEIASRVGMGWVINAGGVITRTVRGVPDEWNTRHYPYAPIEFSWATANYMNRIAGNAPLLRNGFDAEPDYFSFSFDNYSGSFVFDGNMIPKLVSKSPLRIEKNFTSTDWNFKITAPDGTAYFFGGNGAVEKTKREQSCGRDFNAEYIPTAWYLKEIKHRNGEAITLGYSPHNYKHDNGVSQTMYCVICGNGCNNNFTTTCINSSLVSGVLLRSIQSETGGTVSFQYTARQDCTDSLISKITYSNPLETISSIDLAYTNEVATGPANTPSYYWFTPNTPYLNSITENSTNNTQQRKHYFSYIDPAQRPPRLSFSQDHYGFYNGKINSSFTPYMGELASQGYPQATANKDPDYTFAQKGMLQKIVFPTGGIETIFYEANKYPSTSDYNTKHELTCSVIGTGFNTPVTKLIDFHIDNLNSSAHIIVECTNNGNNGWDPIHNIGWIKINRMSDGVTVFQELCGPGDPLLTYNTQLAPGDYQLVLKAYGNPVSLKGTLLYRPTNYPSGQVTREAGGLRVAKIVSSDLANEPLIKKYYYGTLENLNESSLSYIIGEPVYYSTTYCVAPSWNEHKETLNSSSILNQGYFNGNFVSYNSVVESSGENFEGGGTETQFYTSSDVLGFIVWNNDILNSPFSNSGSFINGKPRKEMIFKKMPNGDFKPVKKIDYTYKLASEETIPGYSISSKSSGHQINCDTLCNVPNNPNPNNPGTCYGCLNGILRGYDMVKYLTYSTWVHPDEQTETIYDENGLNPVTSVTKSYYNSSNYQLSKLETTDSKGQLIRTSYKYPHDDMNNPVYEDMVNFNIVTSLINVKKEIVRSALPNTVLSEQKIDYVNAGNNNFAPFEIKASVKGNALESEGTIDQYDSHGNALQFTSKAGVVTSILWGYNYQYPIAQVVGASYSNVLAQLTVSLINLQTMDGDALSTELNHVRTGLSAAAVTTYTYKPQTGVTSITNGNNITNKYEYDDFQRLKTIKDQNNNFVKKNDYAYAIPDPNSGLNIFLSQQQTQTVTCSTCVPGYTALPIYYTVLAGKYYSLLSQNDADAQATADMIANKQEYVNKNSVCINANCSNCNTNCSNCNATNCTGIDKKCVNGICNTAIRENLSSYQNRFGQWVCVYRFRWSDGSYSPQYTETTSSPCDLI